MKMQDIMPRMRALAAHLWFRLSAALSLLLVFLLAIAVLSYAPQDNSLNSSGVRRLAIGLVGPAPLRPIWFCSFSASPYG